MSDNKQPRSKQFTAEDLHLVQNPDQFIPQIQAGGADGSPLGTLKYDVLSDKTVTLDRHKASEYIDLPIFPGERNVVETHVQRLYDEMRRGMFNPLLVILSTAVLEGIKYKVNGQHTAWAVAYMPESFSMQVREIQYRVKSMEQLKLLYSTYDRLRPRSDAHATQVHLAGTDAAKDLWTSMLNKYCAAFRFWYVESEKQRSRLSPEQAAGIIQKDYHELFNQVGQFVQAFCPSDIARRMPVIAAMFPTFQAVPTKAAEFWKPVLDGLELTNKTDPRYQLREFLVKQHNRNQSGKRLYTAEDCFRIALLCWQKWRKGQTMQTAPRPVGERPRVS